MKKVKNLRPHAAACRRRLEEALKDSSKVKAASERITETLAKMLEEAKEERKTQRGKSEKEQMQLGSQDVEANEGERPKRTACSRRSGLTEDMVGQKWGPLRPAFRPKRGRWGRRSRRATSGGRSREP